MNAKTLSTIILLLFVAASVVYLIVGETSSQQTKTSDSESTTPSAVAHEPQSPSEASPRGDSAASQADATEHVVVAYYFHNTKRCVTCLTIESLAEEALQEEFPDAFAEGRLEWHAVNMEEDGNAHYATDYDLVTSSLVFVDMRGGKQHRWIHMKEVWQLVDDEVAFKAYVVDQARQYLESKS